MADVYLYADETGNLDYNSDGVRTSHYFGFGTALFSGDHGAALWRGLNLRAQMEAGSSEGIVQNMPRGFHAVVDSNRTRAQMFAELAAQAPRVDATLLYKPNAFDSVRARGEMYLYKIAWHLHLKEIITRVSQPGDRVFVIVASLGTKKRATQVRAALADVCQQTRRDVVLCIWDSATSWGLQIADYALWAIQRRQEDRPGTWWDDYVSPTTTSVFFPWGAHRMIPWTR